MATKPHTIVTIVPILLARMTFSLPRLTLHQTLAAGFLVLPIALAGCRIANTQSPAAPVTSPSTAAPIQGQSALPPDAKVYRDPKGAFMIALPKGYEYKETGSGIRFFSIDKGLKGFVDFTKTDKVLNLEELEGALREYLDRTLKKVTWQNSVIEPESRLRVDWTGESQEGEKLDAVSYIQTSGNTIYIMSLYGVNQPFDKYRQDIEVIVGSYRVGLKH
jgi:hypothetical protein